jgi:hypothetical protein
VSLKAKFQNIAQSVMNQFGDLTESVIFSSLKVGKYDPVSGKAGDSVTKFEVPVVFERIHASQKSFSDFTPGDSKVIFAGASTNYVPDTTDTITRSNGDVYEIVDWYTDPAQALYTLLARKR